MPPNLHIKLSKVLSTWQSPSLFNRMFSMVTFGRLVARAITNSISQGEFQYVPITASFIKRSIQHYPYSSPGNLYVFARSMVLCGGIIMCMYGIYVLYELV